MLHDPETIMGPQISERIFKDRQACIDFVNTVSESNEIANKHGTFMFSSVDGMIFKGGCIQNEEEFDKLTIMMGFI